MKFEFSFIPKKQGSIKDDILSGLTVSLALVPEAVAFAFVAGVSPVVGLYGAFMMGLVTSIFGGRPGNDFRGNRCNGSCDGKSDSTRKCFGPNRRNRWTSISFCSIDSWPESFNFCLGF